jgi:hypothetical protein
MLNSKFIYILQLHNTPVFHLTLYVRGNIHQYRLFLGLHALGDYEKNFRLVVLRISTTFFSHSIF